jgi:hypothetical protein
LDVQRRRDRERQVVPIARKILNLIENELIMASSDKTKTKMVPANSNKVPDVAARVSLDPGDFLSGSTWCNRESSDSSDEDDAITVPKKRIKLEPED